MFSFLARPATSVALPLVVSALTLIAFVVLPASFSSAAPQVTDDPAAPSHTWATVGDRPELNMTINDPTPCLDNTGYDEENEVFIDPLNNDDDMLGAIARVELLQGEQWAAVPGSGSEVTAQQLENQCELNPPSGSIALYASAPFTVPAERTQVRMRVAGGQAGLDLVGAPLTLWPRFRESWVWSPGPSMPREVRKGYKTLTITADRRLVGTKVILLWSANSGKTFRSVQTRSFRSKGKKAYVRLQHKLPKNNRWQAWACVEYNQNFPQMGNGVACPRGKISGKQLEALLT